MPLPMTFLYPRRYRKCLPPSAVMNSVSPLLVTESVTIVVPGYFLGRQTTPLRLEAMSKTYKEEASSKWPQRQSEKYDWAALECDVCHKRDVAIGVYLRAVWAHDAAAINVSVHNNAQVCVRFIYSRHSSRHGPRVFWVGHMIGKPAVRLQELTACRGARLMSAAG